MSRWQYLAGLCCKKVVENVKFTIKIYLGRKVQRMKINYVILSLLLVFVSYSCAGKESVKPSADSLLTKDVFNRIDTIKNAYEAKDTGILKNQINADIVDPILKNLNFEKAELFFTPRMVKITNESVIVNLNWQGIWLIAKDKKIENRGLANLVLQRREALKLIQIEGDNPFLMPLITEK